MTNLYLAELRRIASRRLVRLTLLIVGVGIVAGGVIAFAKSGSVSDAVYRQRAHQAEVQQKAQLARARQCLAAHGVQVGEDYSRAITRACAPKHFASAHDPRFHRHRLADVVKGSSGVLAIIGWALGASLVGAEFASRGMTTLLTFETRRSRVFLAKVGAVLTAAAAFALVALVALALALLPAALLHGAPLTGADPGLATVAGIIARGTALVVVTTGIGFAIATLGRNTAAALAVGFGYIVVLEQILGNSLASWRPWLLLGNVIVFMSGQNGGGDVAGRTVVGAGLFLAAVTLALLAAAAGSFRTRDIA